MPLADVAALLQRVSLDRKTKLQVLAILAANPDAKVAADVETLLRSYEEMDRKEQELLTKRLAEIQKAYQEAVKASSADLGREVLTAQDDIRRNEEIERIRKSLTEL